MFLCFFFKQKTAYEMRISDWSSDVCSSDLPAHRYALDAARRTARGRGNRADRAWRIASADGAGALYDHARCAARPPRRSTELPAARSVLFVAAARDRHADAGAYRKIGRAHV